MVRGMSSFVDAPMLRRNQQLRAWRHCRMRRQLLRPMKGYLSTCGGETACAGVSANSVTINDVQNGGITVPGTSSGGGGGGLSTGAIVGIVIGALAGLLLLCKQFQPPADHAACATFELRIVVFENDPP